ncbi:hypothetical protein [Candidatus Poriferisodalis sp.]|uniref:hypothetical protein n=1 Tax=Candidatus Poriferisodalis sp. TaxID=3101277 RepID=UPI003B0297DB
MARVQGAHLVGSAPVSEPDELFALVRDHLAGHLRRVPDGEIGERDTWIAWQFPKLSQCPQLETRSVNSAYLGREVPQHEVVEGAGPLELVDLGYADAALASWERFAAAQGAGTLPPNVRFMVGLPSPLSVVTLYVAEMSRPAVLPAWTTAMEAQLARILDGIPNDRLAIQWEACIEFGILEGLWTFLDTGSNGVEAREGIAAHIAYLGNLVPGEVEMGYHLCYGDAGHQHFVEPSDTSHLAWAAQTLLERVNRRINWIHLPVPKQRDDDAYFEALAAVEFPDETELYLGLVHVTGGQEGTRRRIATASRHVPRFGLATECGFGRRPISQLPALLDQHAALSASWDS